MDFKFDFDCDGASAAVHHHGKLDAYKQTRVSITLYHRLNGWFGVVIEFEIFILEESQNLVA